MRGADSSADQATSAAGVALDLYDGCLIVDLDAGGLTVIDLDTYSRGPTVNTMGRMFGSTTFMAPQEFELGAAIDQRTTVFTLGRLVWHFATPADRTRRRLLRPARAGRRGPASLRPGPEPAAGDGYGVGCGLADGSGWVSDGGHRSRA